MSVEIVASGNREDSGMETGIPTFFAQAFLHFLRHFVASILSFLLCSDFVGHRSPAESQLQTKAALLGSLHFSAGNYVFLKITF